MTNPFTEEQGKAWGPGSFEMVHHLVKACGIRPGMRVLEVGGGSGHIASVLEKHWQVQVMTLEPWTDGSEIQETARRHGVEQQVLPLKLYAQQLPFADNTFDAIISIGSFEMIGEERPQALRELTRVAKPGSRIGIAEPMRQEAPMPAELAQLDEEHKLGFQQCFSTLAWNMELFQAQGLQPAEASYFSEAAVWWKEYAEQADISEAEKTLIRSDRGRWLSLGMVVGEKV
ncbi:class I SAM-dependent methyltransferase [Ectobacillus ponti]|uniref:Class I SAM-dependent methyltransferase n=1 Tax=Ectobacillus ponti TaxID=2961894 RepID=A0AA41XBM7_9BACI|nr:class I SAM-dependent methyltransferase [Ectobacillus ponti]MCP8970683.1 class I SAM-dependent methyltransferase [Ectobacillus ponti]